MRMISLRTDKMVESDEEIVGRVLDGDLSGFELILRRHNQTLYRVARSILKDETEAEDVVQETYARAFAHLEQFEGRSRFSTWLIRIAVHESFARLRRRKQTTAREEDLAVTLPLTSNATPEDALLADSLRRILESAIDSLPPHYRSVVVLREINGLNTLETAQCLEISVEATKVRLHRARSMLKRRLASQLQENAREVFPLGGSRCDKIVERVLARIIKADAFMSPENR